MKHTCTQNQLLRYVYNETTTAETNAIAEALNEDRALFEAYEDLLHAKDQFPQIAFNPSASSIQNILNYSERTAVEIQH